MGAEFAIQPITPRDWLAGATYVIDRLDGRERRIASTRILPPFGASMYTLQRLGDEFGITRERVRQIQRSLEKAMTETADSEYAVVMADAREALRSRGVAFPVEDLPFRDMELPGRFLLWYTGPYRIVDEWVLRARFDTLGDLARQAFEAVADRGTATQQEFHDSIVEHGVDPAYAEAVAEELPLQLLADHVILPARVRGERAVQRLKVFGRPMSMDELYELEPPDVKRQSFANAVHAHPDIVRTGKNRYELAEWGGQKYPGIVAAMAERLRETPRLAIADLGRDLSDAYGVSPSSIDMSANMHPLFVTESGYVRLRRPDEPCLPEASLENTAGCYLINGHWALRIDVDHNVLRGSGLYIPKAFAVHLGSQPLAKGHVNTRSGSLSIRWGVRPSIGSIRRHAESLGLEREDWIFLVRTSPRTVEFTGLTRKQLAEASPTGRAKLAVGADPDDSRDAVQAIGEAIGLDGKASADPALVKARLESRKDELVLELLEKAQAIPR
ncbi:MAG: sigma factor-like helix-turn-helix DNA-binding protein [Acidimicrobiia bacterium]